MFRSAAEAPPEFERARRAFAQVATVRTLLADVHQAADGPKRVVASATGPHQLPEGILCIARVAPTGSLMQRGEEARALPLQCIDDPLCALAQLDFGFGRQQFSQRVSEVKRHAAVTITDPLAPYPHDFAR